VTWFGQLRSRQYDDAIVRSRPTEFERLNGHLMKVVDAVAISGEDARFLYDVVKAIVQPSANTYRPTTMTETNVFKALSVSELSNHVKPYSYGVTKANIPAGFTAVKIPVGSFVWCVPHRMKDGAFIWLIVNTQAIDGVCT